MPRPIKISEAVVRRLPLYLRVLDDVAQTRGIKLLSSQELGERAGVTPALVRKDLAWFGEFGKQGVGYDVHYLRNELRRILHLDREVRIALVGMGNLGVALARYHRRRYLNEPDFHLHIVAMFDSDPRKIGVLVEGVPVLPVAELPGLVERLNIKLAIIAVPAEAAQGVADQLVGAGVKGILNFAPMKLKVPEDVHVVTADLSAELQCLAFYLQP
ncbi:MAG: redox-sensing transcriptional repressor Rex [Limnochordales bacterium]|nr:redox-sensing transcriptional repressor Rex [Limnochordales bacterium]